MTKYRWLWNKLRISKFNFVVLCIVVLHVAAQEIPFHSIPFDDSSDDSVDSDEEEDSNGIIPQNPVEAVEHGAAGKEMHQDEYTVCDTPICLEAARFYKSAMDLSVDPCEDFFKFTCGGWVNSKTIPSGRSMWGVSNVMMKDIEEKTIDQLNIPVAAEDIGTIPYIKTFYQSCLATEKLQKNVCIGSLLKGLKDIGGFPFVDPHNYNSTWTSTLRMGSAIREFGYSFIIDLDVKEFNRHHIIHIKPVIRFGLDRASLFRPNLYPHKIEAYKTYIMNVMCFLRNGCTDDTKEELTSMIDNIVKFESDLVTTISKNVQEDAEDEYYYRKSLARLIFKVPNVDWMRFINTIFQDADIEVTRKTKVAVKKEKHLRRIGKVLKNTDDEIVANYLGWRFIQTIGPYSCSAIKNFDFEFHQKTKNITTSTSYPKMCYHLVKKYFDLAVGRLYVKKHFSKQTMDDMKDMLTSISKAFKTLLKGNTWMDGETKAKAERKLDLMQNLIGYPFWIMNERRLNKFYPVPKDLFDKSDFIGSLQKLMKFRTNEDIDKLTQAPCDSDSWKNNPIEVNAFYSKYINTMKFPAGYLIIPNYWPSVISAINYGGIGNTIGHEMTHAFDNGGRQFDGYGNLHNWWSKKTLQEFEKRMNCFVKQYSSTFDPVTNLTLQGNLTIADDIADNGGIRQSYMGYLLTNPTDERLPGLEEFSSKKLYFIAMGCTYCTIYKARSLDYKIRNSKHSPDMYRVNLPVMNFDVFSEVFNCKVGTPMNPPNKCVLW